MADDDNEIRFAKKLASNDGGKRRQAMKGLSAWLQARSSAAPKGVMAELELRKLWRGLFFSMWFADGAKVQNELASKIAELVHCLKTAEGVAGWLHICGRTMRGEWGKLDKYRIDKYYVLLRRVVHETFAWLSKRQFGPVAEVADALKATFFAQATLCPAGIRLHVADLYAEELVAAGGAALATASVLAAFEPLLQELAATPDKVFFARALKGSVQVLPQLLKAACPRVELAAVQARLFAMAADPLTLDRYRAELYATHGAFQAATGQRSTLAAVEEKPKNPAALKAADDENSEEEEEKDEEGEDSEAGAEEMDDDEESDDEEESEEESEEEPPPPSQKKAKSGAVQAAPVQSAKRKAGGEEGARVKRRVSFGANQSVGHVASIKALKKAAPSLLSPSPKRGILATRVATPGKALKKGPAAASPKVAPTTPSPGAPTPAKKKGAALSTPRRKASDFF